MSNWNDGYVADIDYIHGYYDDLNPQRLSLLMLAQGLQPPPIQNACELGFGLGLSLNLHAAASPVQWWGTDFNPAQVSAARELAQLSGAQLFDQSFADFCQRADLPEFDFIALHGIWSWISDENRAIIVDFARRKLRAGGVFYVSYNCQPGWAAFAPMQHLMAEHGDVMGNIGSGSIARVQNALDFAKRLMETQPLYAAANPHVAERLDGLQGKNTSYLAHEYFNRNWHPMHFSDVARLLEPAQLQFASSSQYLDAVDIFHLTPEQQAFMATLPQGNLRQSVRDFMVNQQFRRDYFVKGPRRISGLPQLEALRSQRVVLRAERAAVPLKSRGARGEASLKPEMYEPLLDLLADHQPRSLGQIEQALAAHGNFQQWLQAVLVLTGMGHLAPAQDEAALPKVRKRAELVNRYLLQRSRINGDTQFLASPLIGGGMSVGRFEQLLLQARAQGAKTPADWALYASQHLRAQGQRMLKDGQALEDQTLELAELTARAEALAKNLNMLKALQVI